MPKPKKSANLDHHDDGYTSDIDQDFHLKRFKTKFRKRLEQAAVTRISRNDVPVRFRRVDSLARLLEGSSICAAAYFDIADKELWLANNKVHTGSHQNNEQIKAMKAVFALVSDEKLSIEDIFTQLTTIICCNIRQEKRFDLGKLANIDFDLEETVENWLKDMFKSNRTTKQWRDDTIENFEYETTDTENIIKKLIRKTARLTRDFLKLRDFLLGQSKHDAVTRDMLAAIRAKRFRILHTENKDVHAEIRVIAEMIKKGRELSYVSISKLCCDHCALAMDAFGAQSRGRHGQRGNWPLAGFIANNPLRLRQYVGADAYEHYQKLSSVQRAEALEFVASAESNSIKENASHGRYMEADSSDSDIEFGLDFSDVEQEEEISQYSLNKVWQLRHINLYYKTEFERLEVLGLEPAAIIALHNESAEKFTALTGKSLHDLINRMTESEADNAIEIFEKFSQLYDDNLTLFESIIEDDDELIVEYGFEAVCDRYAAISNGNTSSDDNDVDAYTGESINIYDQVAADLREENGWGYDYNSDDSQNCWGYNDASNSEAESYPYSNDDNSASEYSASESDFDPESELSERFNRFGMQ